MKHIGTVLFLVGCLAVGLLLGQLWINHKSPAKRSTTASARPFGGALPAVRGVETTLGLESTPDQWTIHASHISQLGGTWMSVESPAAAYASQGGAAALEKIVNAGHGAGLKVMAVCTIGTVESKDGVAPPPYATVEPAFAAIVAAKADMMAVDPHMGDAEPADDAWMRFVTQIKDTCPVPLCFVADYSACVRVSWWAMPNATDPKEPPTPLVDYVGVRGPIELTDRPDAATEAETLLFLENSWRARQDVVASLHLRDNIPVIFLGVYFPGTGRRTKLSYQAALINARGTAGDSRGNTEKTLGTPWLAGLFVRLPEGAEAAPVEQIIQKDWK